MTLQEIIGQLFGKNVHGGYYSCYDSFFVNGKKVSKKKIINILTNNYPKTANFSYSKKSRLLPYFIGHWTYFEHRYSNGEKPCLSKISIHISVTW